MRKQLQNKVFSRRKKKSYPVLLDGLCNGVVIRGQRRSWEEGASDVQEIVNVVRGIIKSLLVLGLLVVTNHLFACVSEVIGGL